MQYCTRDRIHDPHDERDQYGCNQHDHRRLLQLRPRRPGHFFQQLLIRLPEIGRDFVHDFFFFPPATRLPIQISTPPDNNRPIARALGFEPRLKVLETSVLPLYYARIYLRPHLELRPHHRHNRRPPAPHAAGATPAPSHETPPAFRKTKSYPVRNSSQFHKDIKNPEIFDSRRRNAVEICPAGVKPPMSGLRPANPRFAT